VAESEWLSLDPGEAVVWRGAPRLRRIASNVASFVFWALVAFVAAAVITTVLRIALPVPDLAVWGVAVLFALLKATGPVRAYLQTEHTDYVLTNTNLYEKTGVWSENVTRVGVDKIQNTQLKKDFFGNIFDYGTILVSTAGGSGVELSIDDLNDPDELRDALRTQMAQASQQPQHDAAPGAGGIDPETVQALADEAQKLRETAETIERHLHP
jgi:uncharacterized membrane protein YdbT with pleckstrin-like domain